jgi:hypothetical protein
MFYKSDSHNEKRSVHKFSGAVQQNTQSNVQRIFSSSSPHEPIPTHARQNLFSCLLPLCYRNTPTQAHPARSRLLHFLVFLLRYVLLGLLSLVNRASLNQRAVGFQSLSAFRVVLRKVFETHSHGRGRRIRFLLGFDVFFHLLHTQ